MARPIPIDRTGRALNGSNSGLYVRVEMSGGGFLIVLSEFPDLFGGERGFDHWVEDGVALYRYFSAQEVDWEIPDPDYEAPRPGDIPGH